MVASRCCECLKIELWTRYIHARILDFEITYCHPVCTQSGVCNTFKCTIIRCLQNFRSNGSSDLSVEYFFAGLATFGREITVIVTVCSNLLIKST